MRLKELKQYEAAEKELREALEIDPNNVSLYLDLGKVLKEMNRYQEAKEICKKGLQAKPEYLDDWDLEYFYNEIKELFEKLEERKTVESDISKKDVLYDKKANPQKKRRAKKDLFDIKVAPIQDNETLEALLYHMRTGNCPYNKKECKPENCPKSGMKNCPIHL